MKEGQRALQDERNILAKEKQILKERVDHLQSELTNAKDQLHVK